MCPVATEAASAIRREGASGTAEKRDLAVLLILYTLVHVGILSSPDAVFWDDWLLFQTNPDDIVETFRQAGSIGAWPAYLHLAVLNVGMWLYKLLTFIFMLGAGIMLYLTLGRMPFVPALVRFVTATLFLVLPFNIARISAIMLPYSLCYFLFFAAWFLMGKHRKTSLLLFVLSFNINSLLVFYVLPFLELISSLDRIPFKSLLKRVSKYWAFLLAPPLYFFIKRKFFPATGLYSDYKTDFALDNLMPVLTDQLNDLSNLEINYAIFLATLPVCFFLLTRAPGMTATQRSPRLAACFIATGFGIILLGGFPYWILDLVPTVYEWSSRHQLLFPLGASVLLAGGTMALPEKLMLPTITVLVAASASFFISNYLDFALDWKKQQAIAEFLVADENVQKVELIVFNDKSRDLNAIKRTYRFYEWNGLLNFHGENQKRLGINLDQIDAYREGSLDRFFSPLYKAELHNRGALPNAALVTISRDADKPRRPWGNALEGLKFESLIIPVSEIRP